MKKVITILIIIIIASCNRTMDSWPVEDEDNQNVELYIRTRNIIGINAEPSIYHFFIYDSIKGIVTSQNINKSSSQMQLKLLPGKYSGFCVTNASNIESWEYSESDHPSEIYLTSNELTGDHLLGSTKFEVKEVIEGEEANNATFELVRKVSMLNVIITHIPENLNDLKINVSEIPEKMNLLGKYEGDHTISKNITNLDANRASKTSILLFPPQGKNATISLSSKNLQFMTLEHTIDTILVNHITELNIRLWSLDKVPTLDITSTIVNWEEKIIKEEDWEVIVPDGPCEGSGNGVNLIQNGGLESAFSDGVPLHWEVSASSSSYTHVATLVENPINTGTKAVKLNSKTYLSQEISIIGGRCYQFKAHTNSPHKDVTWEVSGTWKKASSPLTSLSEVIRTEEQNKTEGYIDAYKGQVFRAPETATKLHIEIKNTSDSKVTEGLYVDDISIELVD